MQTWLKIGTIVVSLLPKVIGLIERVKGSAPGAGAEKRAAVREMVMTVVGAIEGAKGVDIFNDPEVLAAYDAVNDAIVAFQNVLVKKAAP